MRNTKIIKISSLLFLVITLFFAIKTNAAFFDTNAHTQVGPDTYMPQTGAGPPSTSASSACRSLQSGHTVFRDIIGFVNCTISTTIIPLLFSLAVLVFIWGVIQYVISPDDEGKRKGAKDTILYGIIGLFVMISVWGLVKILGNTFGVQNTIPSLTEPQ